MTMFALYAQENPERAEVTFRRLEWNATWDTTGLYLDGCAHTPWTRRARPGGVELGPDGTAGCSVGLEHFKRGKQCHSGCYARWFSSQPHCAYPPHLARLTPMLGSYWPPSHP